MRNLRKYIAVALALVMASSCYKDDSTVVESAVPEIKAAQGSADTRFYKYMEEVDWSPELTYSDVTEFTEEDYENYDYRWRITASATNSDTTRMTLSSTRALKTVIGMMPSNNAYDLALYMTNRHTGMEHVLYWDVMVEGELGAGLMVAHTRDESTSDISLIKAYHYSGSMWETVINNDNGFPLAMSIPKESIVYDDVYSAANLAPVDGLVSSMAFATNTTGGSTYTDIQVCVKGKTIMSLNPLSLLVRARNEQEFSFVPDVINPRFVFSLPRNMYQRMVVVNDGHAQFYNTGQGVLRFYPMVPEDVNYEIADDIAVPVMGMLTQVNSLLWDKKNSQIVALNTVSKVNTSFQTSPMPLNVNALPAQSEGSRWDFHNLSGFDCIFAGYISNDGKGGSGNFHTSAWLLKDKNTGNLQIRTLGIGMGNDTDWEDAYMGLGTYDASGCTDLASATCYTTTVQKYKYNSAPTGERGFYYAAGNKIYATMIPTEETGSLTSNLIFTADAEEAITHISFTQSTNGDTYWSKGSFDMIMQQPSQDNLLTVATWNASTKEGKIYALPRQYVGSGGLAPAEYRSEWGGFGRITSICIRE